MATSPPRSVRHVEVVGLLTLVQGVVVLFFGVFLVLYGWHLLFGPRRGFAVGLWGYVLIPAGVAVLPVGVLGAVAGVRLRAFKNRGLGLAGLFSNTAVVVLSTVAAPLGVALAIYAAVVLFRPEVVRAFELVARGATREEAMRDAARWLRRRTP